MESQHMNPSDAGKAFELLKARTFVAMHWGTFKLTTNHRRAAGVLASVVEGARPRSRAPVIPDVGETRALV